MAHLVIKESALVTLRGTSSFNHTQKMESSMCTCIFLWFVSKFLTSVPIRDPSPPSSNWAANTQLSYLFYTSSGIAQE